MFYVFNNQEIFVPRKDAKKTHLFWVQFDFTSHDRKIGQFYLKMMNCCRSKEIYLQSRQKKVAATGGWP